jgi:hypothetical protein
VAARLRQIAFDRDSLIRQGLVMPDAAIDACSLIDLLASGEAEAILRASGFTWHLPSAVQSEVTYCRQHDQSQPGKIVTVPVDLSALISTGLLTVCNPQDQPEIDGFTHYAAIFRSDGEAMCLAIAEQRKWVMVNAHITPGDATATFINDAVAPLGIAFDRLPIRLTAISDAVAAAREETTRRRSPPGSAKLSWPPGTR